MESIKYNLILGSGSPRRKELLGWTGISFKQMSADIEESSNEKEPSKIVVDLARQKAQAICKLDELPKNPFLITSDTIVVFNNTVLGKPASKKEAKEILSQLSGNSHRVFTAVSFYKKENENWNNHSFYSESEVTFSKITDDLMELYLESDECMDKAGAYGIQGQGLIFVENVVGSYSNVVGFPLSNIILEMKKFLKIDENKDLRELFF